MACSITATVGSSSSNSYVTVNEADTYFDTRLQATAWSGSSSDEKCRALVQATYRIDQERFHGERDTEGQALQWPRFGAYDFDGIEYSASTIPEIVKRATYEMALHLLDQDDSSTDPLSNTGLEGFREVAVGSVRVEKDQTFVAGELPANVARLLAPVRVSPLSARMVRS